jgi:hypothetical protein
MGDGNFSLIAYYPYFYSLLTGNNKNNYEEDKTFKSSIVNKLQRNYLPLWQHFAEYINNSTKFYFDYSMYSKENAKRNRYIAIPIYHSLISMQDKRVLSVFFNEYSSVNHNNIDIFKIYFLNWKRKTKLLSKRVEFHLNNKETQDLIIERIFFIYQRWDHCIYNPNDIVQSVKPPFYPHKPSIACFSDVVKSKPR